MDERPRAISLLLYSSREQQREGRAVEEEEGHSVPHFPSSIHTPRRVRTVKLTGIDSVCCVPLQRGLQHLGQHFRDSAW